MREMVVTTLVDAKIEVRIIEAVAISSEQWRRVKTTPRKGGEVQTKEVLCNYSSKIRFSGEKIKVLGDYLHR